MSSNAFFIDPRLGLAVRKAPGAKKPYTIDWSEWLAGGGLTMKTSTWSGAPGIVVESPTLNGNSATALISGGVAGQNYQITNTIETQEGPTEVQTFMVMVK